MLIFIYINIFFMDDRLKRMFEESRLRHQNEKRQYTKKKKTKYQLPSNIKHLLVKIENAKQTKIKRIEALGGIYRTVPCNDEPTHIKRSQKQNIWHNPLIEGLFGKECDLYLTREELMEAEQDPNESGMINWDVWDRLVDEFRKNNNIFPE